MPDDDKRARPEPAAWDRVGQMMQDMAAVTMGIANRNQRLWGEVSNNLRGGSYPADAMTTDFARSMNTAMDNLEDLWTFATRPPERERVATTLPTVFLLLKKVGGVWSVDDPVWIRVPYWERDSLPQRADVYLDGDPDRVKPLKASLRVQLVERAYRVEVAGAKELSPGVYVGLIAAGTRPLASLRIVVDDGGQ
jgi:hypothetical protein